jgi:flavin-binding protein dodecin
VGAAEAILPDAKLTFSRTSPSAESFRAAIHAALARAQADTARVAQPRSQLVYDPEVDTHVARLYQLMQTV